MRASSLARTPALSSTTRPCVTATASPSAPSGFGCWRLRGIRPAEPPVLFSGGSLLVGAVSRTDLLGHEHATGLAHQLYHSLHERILPLGDDVVAYPTHGGGSFCTAEAGSGSTTIGSERLGNALLALTDPKAFADRLLVSM